MSQHRIEVPYNMRVDLLGMFMEVVCNKKRHQRIRCLSKVRTRSYRRKALRQNKYRYSLKMPKVHFKNRIAFGVDII